MKKRIAKISPYPTAILAATGLAIGVVAWTAYGLWPTPKDVAEGAGALAGYGLPPIAKGVPAALCCMAAVAAAQAIFCFLAGRFSRTLVPVVTAGMAVATLGFGVASPGGADALIAWLAGAGCVYIAGIYAGNVGRRMRHKAIERRR